MSNIIPKQQILSPEKKTAAHNCSSGQPILEDCYSVVIEKESDRNFNCSIVSRCGILVATAKLIEIEEGTIYHAFGIRQVNRPWEPPS